MTIQEQEQIINLIKTESAENEKANTIKQTKLESYLVQITDRLNEMSEEQVRELAIQIERLSDKKYVDELLSILSRRKETYNSAFERVSSDALSWLGISRG